MLETSGPRRLWCQGPVSGTGVGRGDGPGGNVSDGEWQMEPRTLTCRSLPAVRPGS